MADELTFRSSRARGLFVLILSWCFVALGFWLVSEGERLFGWLSAGFFVLGIPVGLIMMFYPNAMYLRLDPEGFEMGSFIRKFRIKWTDVAGFEMRRMHYNKMIAIIYAPLDEILQTLEEWRERYGKSR